MFTNPSKDRLPLELEWPLPLIVWLRRFALLGLAAAVPAAIGTLLSLDHPNAPAATLTATLAALASLCYSGGSFLSLHALTKQIRDLRQVRAIVEQQVSTAGAHGVSGRIAEIDQTRLELEDAMSVVFKLFGGIGLISKAILDSKRRVESIRTERAEE
jgi:hypothetical protein